MTLRTWGTALRVLPIAALFACAAQKPGMHASMPTPAYDQGAPDAPPAEAMAQTPAAAAASPGASPVAAVTAAGSKTGAEVAPTISNAMVIYTGGVSMLEDSERFPALIDQVIDLSETMGGRLQARRDDGVTIRVPSLRFREAMSRIDRLGAVTHRTVSADDVTEEFHDAEVRLQNLQATRKRLQDFLAKANDIPATLTVEHELERVTQEIDQLEGRMHFLQSRASLSTIDVQLAAKPRPIATVVAEPAPPAPPPSRPQGIQLPIGWLADVDADHLASF